MSLQPRNWETSLTVRRSDSAGYPPPLPPAEMEDAPLLKLHSQLRGRYLWAVGVAVVCGLIGGIWGYRQKAPLYQSEALVRIQPVLPRILYNTDNKGLMPMYEQFFATQLKLIGSPRVLSMAMEQPEWQALGRGRTRDIQMTFSHSLEVTNPSGTELIEISFQDLTSAGSLAGVHSILEAYFKVYNEQEEEEESQRLKVLNERRDKLQKRVQSINEQLMAIAGRYGTDTLDAARDAKFKRLDHLESMLDETKWMLTTAEMDKMRKPPEDVERRLTLDEIAQNDTQLQEILKKRWELEHEMQVLLINHKPAHPEVLKVRQNLASVEETIKKYVDDYRATQPPDAVKRPWEMQGVPAVVTLDQLRERERRLKELSTPAEAEVIKLGQDNLEMKKFRAQADEVEKSLAETRARIEQLSVEAAVAGRVQIVSKGEMPTAPTKDPRGKWAAIGASSGSMIGFGLVALLALFDRRMRRLEQVRQGIQRLPILGILPWLPRSLDEPAEAAIAVHCVHQLRARLQLPKEGPPQQVFAITSPAAGDGKTSLALSLALSFAGTHARTLLIDMDVIGGGFSSRLEPLYRPRLGDILTKRGLATPTQIEEALALANENSKKLGAALAELGYVSEEHIAEALIEQVKPQPGVIEVLAGGPLDASLLPSRVPHLFVLQLGSASLQAAGHFSSSFVHKLLDDARQRFDAVIVDTGPIPGSLEASLVAPQADAVVLVVSRGTSQPLTTSAIEHLTSLNVVPAGVVFNRAKIRDVRTYSQPSARDQNRYSNARPPLVIHNPEETASLGPVASAVAMSIRPPAAAGAATEGSPFMTATVESRPFETNSQTVSDAVIETSASTMVAEPPPAAPSNDRGDGDDEPEKFTVTHAMARAQREHRNEAPAIEPKTEAVAPKEKPPAPAPAADLDESSDEDSGFFRTVLADTGGGSDTGLSPLETEIISPQPAPSETLAPTDDISSIDIDALTSGDTDAIEPAKPVVAFISIRCPHCRVKLAIRAKSRTRTRQCPQCHGQLSVASQSSSALMALEMIDCDGCGRRYATRKRADGSFKARCPYCHHRSSGSHQGPEETIAGD